eukprot:CAMPEP_0179302616 /NCGR_PEP_ID=MMETSP0797-20121207/48158_1 /TAXON_ID=47934 /ORGANISM="Dinophysis acuminata, Strain DAEP01" /LENGTH=81 /DNA_ID=CAMNT_0021012155 /DNA_START=71 /DNA_END=316 /DNA_ORIENTATION=+
MSSFGASVMALFLALLGPTMADPAGQFLSSAAMDQSAAAHVTEVSMPSSPYMQTNPTAEALAALFMFVTIVICWLECCGKK